MKDTQLYTDLGEMFPQWYSQEDLKLPDYQLYRVDAAGQRWYFELKEGQQIFYRSITAALAATLPTSKPLVDWKIAQGAEYEQIAKDAANYGTVMHILLTEWLCANYDNGYSAFNLTDISSLAQMIENKLGINGIDFDRLFYDYTAFTHFAKTVELQPLAIELVLRSQAMKWAGALDIVCELTHPKAGKVLCIIDLKSGRKGFYNEHSLQLAAQRQIWNENYPGTPIELIFNWSPKEPNTKREYNWSLQDQTHNPINEILPYLVILSNKPTVMPVPVKTPKIKSALPDYSL